MVDRERLIRVIPSFPWLESGPPGRPDELPLPRNRNSRGQLPITRNLESAMSASSPQTCPFCTMPSDRIVEENEHAYVVLDAYPVASGHSLVVSRRHVGDVFELSDDEITSMLRLIKAARERIDRSLHPDGYNVGVNVGKVSGQTIPHVHIHVIPRYQGDIDDPTGGVRGVIPEKMRYPR